MKMTRGKTTIEVSDNMVDYYENKGWVVDSGKVSLKPAPKNTVETPAVESEEDSEEVVNENEDANKGD